MCDLSRDYTAYRGQVIAVRGIDYCGLRQTCPETCATGPWPSFVDLASTDMTVRGEPPFGFETPDTALAALDKAEREAEREARQGRRVEVWVTIVGRLRASEHRSPVGPCDRVVNSGYGHLGGYPAQLVIRSVNDIKLVAKPDSLYDYSHMYRGAL